MNGRTYPVDLLLSAYNLVLAGLWLPHIARWPYAIGLVSAHLGAALLPTLLRRATLRTRGLRTLRSLYPLALLLAFWTEVDLVRRTLHAGANDGVVIRLEAALLGFHPHEIWMPSMHQLWVSELLHFSYFAYYGALVLPVLWLWARGRTDALMDALFRMMALFTLCFLLFALFPVDGPQHTGELFHGPHARGPFARLVRLVAVDYGEALGAAFPSSHVAGAVTMAWIGRLYLPRWAFRLLAMEAVGVFLSTFYIQQHYAIDAVAGAVLALVVQGAAVPLLLRRAARPPPPLRPTRVTAGSRARPEVAS